MHPALDDLNRPLKGKKIAIVVSTPMTAKVFLADQIKSLSDDNDVTVVANFAGNEEFIQSFDGITLKSISIPRNISPILDVLALLKLVCFLMSARFDIVHSVSPKAGLLAMAASWLVRVPFRFHTFTGQVWVTKSGFARAVLKNLDKLIVFFSSSILIDSPSQRDFLISEKVVHAMNSNVLASGSISGVDTNRFSVNKEVSVRIREKYSIPQDALVLLFLGRLKKEKGLCELVEAFARLNSDDVFLMVVGPDEEALTEELRALAGDSQDRLVFVAYTSEPESFMTASDIFCLPSYREGFGSVVIEAAACGVPSVASNIYGLTDAVLDGVTGVLVEPCNMESLREGLMLMISDKQKTKQMGLAALERANSTFSQEYVTECLLAFYSDKVMGGANEKNV